MNEELQGQFCIEAEIPLKCSNPVFDEFPDMTDIMILVLRYFKTYLPELMLKKKDCYKRPIKINPKDIAFVAEGELGDYVVIIVPTDDNSTYKDDNFFQEDSEFVFQARLQVVEDDSEGALENLIKLYSGVKTMLVNMDQNLGLRTAVGPFSYDGPYTIEGSKRVVRDGVYSFSIFDTRYKQNG